MSTPPEELPASSESEPKKPARGRTASDGGASSGNGPVVVASANDAPAPPRRRAPGAAASAATPLAAESTAALKPPDGERPSRRARRKSSPADAAAAKSDDGAKGDAVPKADEQRGAAATADVADTTDAKASPAKTSKLASSDEAAPAPPRRSKRAGADTPAPAAAAVSALDAPSLATSEADAEAELVDDTEAPPRRRFGRFGRTVSASIPAVPVVESAPVTVVPAKPITGPTTAVARHDRTYRQTVTKVDLWSVTKLSLCFYLSAMFVTVVAFVALWIIADAAGIIHSVEKFLGDLLSAKNFHFLSATVLRGAILIGLVVVALQVVITVIAASFYNIFAELFGGVEITVKEEGPAEYLDPSLGL